MKRQRELPRGIRNNNPLNIRIGNTWLGEVDKPTDSEFEQFVSMKYGIRAAFLILRRYIRRFHLDNVQLIVSRWAPSNENNTLAYIDHVCRLANLTPTQTIRYEDEEAMVSLVSAMIIHECGQPIDRDIIIQAYHIA